MCEFFDWVHERGNFGGNYTKEPTVGLWLDTKICTSWNRRELFIVFSIGVVWEKCTNSQEHLWWEKTTTAKTK